MVHTDTCKQDAHTQIHFKNVEKKKVSLRHVMSCVEQGKGEVRSPGGNQIGKAPMG